jgi:uncharacterized protein
MSADIAPGVTILEPHECWELLRSAQVGRLAVAIMNQPDIFPVNYVVDHGTVVFRTAEGTKLAAATLGPAVAFEVDGYEPSRGEAWSVVLKGPAVEVENLHELVTATDLPLFPWHAAPKPRFVRVQPSSVTGRRFHVVDHGAAGEPTPGARRRASPE